MAYLQVENHRIFLVIGFLRVGSLAAFGLSFDFGGLDFCLDSEIALARVLVLVFVELILETGVRSLDRLVLRALRSLEL